MKTRPFIQPGRVVLRRQPDGSFKTDWIWQALVVVSKCGWSGQTIKEEGVLLWASNNRRVKPEDYWVNFSAQIV